MSDPYKLHHLKRYGVWVLVARGLIMLAAGIYGMVDPQGALRLLVLIAAILLVADGVLGLISSIFGAPTVNLQFNEVLRNVLAILAGLLIFSTPHLSSEVAADFVITVLGLFAVISGLLEFYLVYKYRGVVDRFWPSVLMALAHLAIGIVLLVLPFQSALYFITLASVLLLIYGAVLLAVAWHMHKADRAVSTRLSH
jgi:uncharacterized membrane protein HdeD (DUF308 family)